MRPRSPHVTISESSPVAMVCAIIAVAIFGILGAISLIPGGSGNVAAVFPAAVGAVFGTLMLLSSRVQVVTDGEHLRVRSWFLGITLLRVRLDEVLRVRVEPSAAARWGNVGPRLTLRGRMIAVRGDRALVLEKKDSARDVLIVVRDADRLAVEIEHFLGHYDDAEPSH